jgi:hypothetical protein
LRDVERADLEQVFFDPLLELGRQLGQVDRRDPDHVLAWLADEPLVRRGLTSYADDQAHQVVAFLVGERRRALPVEPTETSGSTTPYSRARWPHRWRLPAPSSRRGPEAARTNSTSVGRISAVRRISHVPLAFSLISNDFFLAAARHVRDLRLLGGQRILKFSKIGLPTSRLMASIVSPSVRTFSRVAKATNAASARGKADDRANGFVHRILCLLPHPAAAGDAFSLTDPAIGPNNQADHHREKRGNDGHHLVVVCADCTA